MVDEEVVGVDENEEVVVYHSTTAAKGMDDCYCYCECYLLQRRMRRWWNGNDGRYQCCGGGERLIVISFYSERSRGLLMIN